MPVYWTPFLFLLLVIFHGYFFLRLTGGGSLEEKVQTARRYVHTSFSIYVVLPVFLSLLFAFNLAFACIDMRSPQERFVDGVGFSALFIWALFALVIVAIALRFSSPLLSGERRVTIGKRMALFSFFANSIVAMYLSVALWMVAPLFSDKGSIMTMPPPQIVLPTESDLTPISSSTLP